MTIAHEPLVALPAPTVRRGREVRHLHLVPSTPVFVQGALDLECPIPSPQAWAGRYVQAVLEVIAQQRPVSQLARWTAAGVYSELARLQRTASDSRRDADRPRPARQTVVSVRVVRIAADAAAVAARVGEGERSRAVAVG